MALRRRTTGAACRGAALRQNGFPGLQGTGEMARGCVRAEGPY